MATKRTSPKAKTNTRKATARTATRATTKRATAARSAATTRGRATAKITVVPSKSSVKPYLRRLRGLQQISAGVYVLLALAAGYFIKNTSYNLTLGHLTKDDLASKTSTVFAPAVHSVYDLNVRWAVVVILVLSAVLPLIFAYRWRRQYELNIEAEAMPQRWIELGITSALMVEVIALLSGINDLLVLKLIAGLVLAACLLGWLADKQNRQAVKPDWTAYGISVFTGVLPWLLIAASAIGTVVYGSIRAPWYVYALYITTLASFVAIALTQRRHYGKKNQWKFIVIERNYAVINLFAKAAFGIILIIGLHR